MKICIITNEPIPIGGAATNRILSYGKGFVENNVQIKMICLRPTEKIESGIRNKCSIGNYNGIDFIYSSGTTIRSPNFIKRRIIDVWGVLKAVHILIKENKCDKIDAIILLSNSAFHILYFFIISKILKILFIQEKCEFPFVLQNKSLLGKLYAKLYTKYVYKTFDGILVMTKPLEKYFEKRIRKNASLLHVPLTVEYQRFIECPSRINEPNNFIAYCGSINQNKDGLHILIDAFKIISNKYPNLKLYIIGDTLEAPDFNKISAQVNQLNLKEKVLFTGKKPQNEIPKYICSATLLALARPSSLQATGGFPTKLGEYLSSGNPVVVTKVGDIPNYLTDHYNAYLADPDNVESFASKVDYALKHPDISRKIGKRGQELVLEHFNYKTQTKSIIQFISTLLAQKKRNS